MNQVYALPGPDTRENKGQLLSSAQVAFIWNERAAAMGYPNTRYTSFSVRRRRDAGGLVPAMKTPMGYLYHEEDARSIPLQPQKSKRQDRAA